MKNFNKLRAVALLLVLSLGSRIALAVPPATFHFTGFSMNPAFVIGIYNVAKQNNDQVTQLPADLAAFSSVVQIMVQNTGTTAAFPIFTLTVTDPACGNILAGGADQLTTIDPVQPGAPVTLGASQLKLYGSTWSGTTASQCFQNEVKNSFSDPSKIQDAVNTIIHTNFRICIQDVNSPYDQVCTNFTLFNQQSANTTSVPIIIFPHNNMVFTKLPNFAWTAATKADGTAASDIKYRLEITENDPATEPIARVQIPKGQTYYQWSAGDRDLKTGTKYYWRVIGLDNTDNPIGGRDDSGWNVTKWFEISDGVQVAVTLGDLDGWVRLASATDDAIKHELDKMKISGALDPPSLADDLYKQLKDGTATVVGVELSKN